MTSDPPISGFVRGVRRTFGARFIGLLGYGSYFNPEENEPKDIDLVIFLSHRDSDDPQRLGRLGRGAELPYPLQCQIIYEDRLSASGNYYAIHTCGPFFLTVLGNAILLDGENLLKKVHPPERKVLDISILQKVQQYIYQTQNALINLDKLSETDQLRHDLMKRARFLVDDWSIFAQENSPPNDLAHFVSAIDEALSSAATRASLAVASRLFLDQLDTTMQRMLELLERRYETS